MKLLYAIKTVDILNIELIQQIYECINERLIWLEFREPESDGIVHDNWEEKYDDLQDIKDNLENWINEDSKNEKELEDIMESIQDYHYIYGGLSRLTV